MRIRAGRALSRAFLAASPLLSLWFSLWFSLLVSALPEKAFADCTTPAGVAGQFQYIAPEYKYCDGSNWLSMAISNTGVSCSSEPPGKLVYASGDFRFCNGTHWISADSGANSAAGGCAGTPAGTIQWYAAGSTLDWCDGANWKHLGGPGGFTITGIQGVGGADTTTDAYLNYEAEPKIIFGSSANATSYEITVYEADGTTVKCTTQTTTSTTFSPSSCNLTPGASYKIKIVAKTGGVSIEANNSPYAFTYNRAPVVPNRGVWNLTMGGSRSQDALVDDPATLVIDPATDADGDTLTISSVTQGTYGNVIPVGTSVTYTALLPNYDGFDTFTVTVTDGNGAFTTSTVTVDIVSPFRWTGASGVDTKWATNGNWCGSLNAAYNCSGGAAPGSSDTAVFNSRCANCDAAIAAGMSVGGVQMDSSYAGTLSQNSGVSFTIGTKGWRMAGGAFVGSNGTTPANDVTVQGPFQILAGGSFTSTRSTLNLGRSLSIGTEEVYDFLGTFNHNSGTVEFVSTYSSGGPAQYSVGVLSTSGSMAFYNLTVSIYNLSPSTSGSGGYIRFTNLEDTISVEHILRLNSTGFRGGNTRLIGNLELTCALNGRCSDTFSAKNYQSHRVKFVGSTNSTYSAANTYAVAGGPEIYIEKDSDLYTVSSADNNDVRFAAFSQTTGTFNAPSAKLTFGRSYQGSAQDPGITNNNNGTGFFKSGGIFNHNNGTVRFETFSSFNSGSPTGLDIEATGFLVNITSPVEFYNLETSFGNLGNIKTLHWELTNTADVIVRHDLTIDQGYLNGGSLKLFGNIIANCSDPAVNCARKAVIDFSATTFSTEVYFVGSAPQTYKVASGARLPALVIDKDAVGDTVSPEAGSNLAASSIDLRKGTLDLPAQTYLGDFVRSSTGSNRGFTQTASVGDTVLNHNNGTITLDVGTLINNGSLVPKFTFNLNGRPLDVYNLIFDVQRGKPTVGSCVNIVSYDTNLIRVAGDLTFESGAICTGARDPVATTFEISGNLSIKCSDLNTRCASAGSGNSAGVRAKLVGGDKTISQAADATMVFSGLEVALNSNANTLTLQSNLRSAGLNIPTAWSDLFMTKGTLNKNGYSWTNIDLLSITSGATCSGPLSYVSNSGGVGSGCL